jgi:hypothetical protein
LVLQRMMKSRKLRYMMRTRKPLEAPQAGEHGVS